MSEQKSTQPTSGSATADRATLSWSLAGQTLSYTITVEVPNACYSAGGLTHETTAAPEAGKDLIVLKATVDHSQAMCAQVVQDITFTGSHQVASSTFGVRAEVLDGRSGKTTVIE